MIVFFFQEKSSINNILQLKIASLVEWQLIFIDEKEFRHVKTINKIKSKFDQSGSLSTTQALNRLDMIFKTFPVISTNFFLVQDD